MINMNTTALSLFESRSIVSSTLAKCPPIVLGNTHGNKLQNRLLQSLQLRPPWSFAPSPSSSSSALGGVTSLSRLLKKARKDSLSLDSEGAIDSGGPRGMMVLFDQQVHLQKEVGSRQMD
ncbi:hypothetical protein McanCB49686_005964 [Microsporum canis]